MKKFFEVLLWIWQIPQNIAGVFLRLVYGGKVQPYHDVDVVLSDKFPGGISLGRTIIVRSKYASDPNYLNHEYGHTRQSLYLGPLYLFVIGVPSLIWAAYWTPARGVSYYSFYTEKWADKLGGVVRSEEVRG